jgi:hypothetical protein
MLRPGATRDQRFAACADQLSARSDRFLTNLTGPLPIVQVMDARTRQARTCVSPVDHTRWMAALIEIAAIAAAVAFAYLHSAR